MPLLSSPIDGSPMRQIQRFGIELDICPTSGGVWLDKGELEKLMALIKEAAEAETANHSTMSRQHYDEGKHYARSSSHHNYKRDDDNDDYYRAGSHKKKSSLHKVMEIFDF